MAVRLFAAGAALAAWLVASSARADEPTHAEAPPDRAADVASPLQHVVSAGALVSWTSLTGSPLRYGGVVQYDIEIDSSGSRYPLRAFTGMRGAGPLGGALVPVELFAGGGIAAAFGPWRPGVGLELGLTGLHRPEQRMAMTQILGERRDGREGFIEQAESSSPCYLQFDASPLAFAAGAFRVSAGEVGVGTGLAPAGTVLRLAFTVLRLGGAL